MSGKLQLISRTVFLFCAFSIHSGLFAQSKDIPLFDPADLSTVVDAQPESIHVFSFWATWCAPCLKEINLIKSVEKDCKCNLKLHFINVEEEVRKPKALKYATKKDFLDELYFTENVTEGFYTEIDSQWTGAFPALLIIDGKTKKRWFFNQLVSRKKISALFNSIGE